MSAKVCYRFFTSLRLPFLCAALLLTPLSHAANLADEPFWRASVGFWASHNTYMDGEYHPKIPRYQTLNAISVSGNQVISEERKFYPPGTFTGSALGLNIPLDKGVELIQISRGEATGDITVVNFAPLNIYSQNQNTRLEAVSTDTATMTVTYKETNKIAYKMLITVPTAHSRITASLGINSDYAGETDNTPLRGVSVFSATRISESTYQQQTALLQKEYQVGTIVTIDKQGKFVATPLL